VSDSHANSDARYPAMVRIDGRTVAQAPQIERRRLSRRAQMLAGASVVYNAGEAVIAIAAGAAASSIALIGFGLDSIVEMSSGLVILWQFRHPLPESRERTALRLIGVSFFALAAYVTIESLHALLAADKAHSSPVGIVLAAMSAVVMPVLSWAQRRTGRALGSSSVVADSKQTLLCTYLSAVLLVGLLANATLGWAWVDPLVALVIAAVAVREGIEAWRGDACCDRLPTQPAADTSGAETAESCVDGCCPPRPEAQGLMGHPPDATGAARSLIPRGRM
jgi:divalent metal cation (Fe/Co/Zn/Cd) transporter